jgi:hypothetical protein
MKIEECISKKNKILYEEISSKLEIKFRKSTDNNGCWGVVINGKILTIEYGDEENREECFVHELLHAKCQLDGYRRIKWSVSSKDDDGYLSILESAIDNEFQHYKMYKNFVSMGYSLENFFGSNDKETRNHILAYLKNPDKNILMIITQYLTLTSVASDIIFPDIDFLKGEFRKIRGGSISKVLDCIDQELEKWNNTSDYDVSKPLTAIFSQIPGAQYTYFSYTEQNNFSDGFFTGLLFDLDFSNGRIIPK